MWSSGVLQVDSGEWKRVIVEAAEPASMKLDVFRDSGTPIWEAVVSAEEVGHVDWSWLDTNSESDDVQVSPGTRRELQAVKERMSRARADRDGHVEFGRTWPGKRTFIVQAPGFESRYIETTLVAGRMIDLGTVTLREATATVTIRITVANGVDPTKFEVDLFIPFGGRGHRENVIFDSNGTAVVERVPSGRYQVFVSPTGGGGAGHFKRLELVPGDSREVTIDVTRPPGLQED